MSKCASDLFPVGKTHLGMESAARPGFPSFVPQLDLAPAAPTATPKRTALRKRCHKRTLSDLAVGQLPNPSISRCCLVVTWAPGPVRSAGISPSRRRWGPWCCIAGAKHLNVDFLGGHSLWTLCVFTWFVNRHNGDRDGYKSRPSCPFLVVQIRSSQGISTALTRGSFPAASAPPGPTFCRQIVATP